MPEWSLWRLIHRLEAAIKVGFKKFTHWVWVFWIRLVSPRDSPHITWSSNLTLCASLLDDGRHLVAFLDYAIQVSRWRIRVAEAGVERTDKVSAGLTTFPKMPKCKQNTRANCDSSKFRVGSTYLQPRPNVKRNQGGREPGAAAGDSVENGALAIITNLSLALLWNRATRNSRKSVSPSWSESSWLLNVGQTGWGGGSGRDERRRGEDWEERERAVVLRREEGALAASVARGPRRIK